MNRKSITNLNAKLTLAAFVAIATGCANVSQTPSSPSLGDSLPPVAPTTQSPPVSELAGQWKSPCDGDITDNLSTVETITLANSQYTSSFADFENASCSGAPSIVSQFVGTIVSNGASTLVPSATNVIITIASVILTPMTVDMAAEMNLGNECGYTDWQMTAGKTISLSNACLDGRPASLNEIIGIEGGSMYFGNDDDTALEIDFPYIKQ